MIEMNPTNHGAAKPPYCVTPQTVADVFLNASPGPSEDAAPLTPFMIHVWRQHGLDGAETLARAPERERFVYTFYDTFYQTRAPHRLAAPLKTLQWLNRPALGVSSGFEAHRVALGAPNCYMTRYMLNVWKKIQRNMDIFQPEGYLRFLTWFALECIPVWNLPRYLLPDDLLPVLNRPVQAAASPDGRHAGIWRIAQPCRHCRSGQGFR